MSTVTAKTNALLASAARDFAGKIETLAKAKVRLGISAAVALVGTAGDPARTMGVKGQILGLSALMSKGEHDKFSAWCNRIAKKYDTALTEFATDQERYTALHNFLRCDVAVARVAGGETPEQAGSPLLWSYIEGLHPGGTGRPKSVKTKVGDKPSEAAALKATADHLAATLGTETARADANALAASQTAAAQNAAREALAAQDAAARDLADAKAKAKDLESRALAAEAIMVRAPSIDAVVAAVPSYSDDGLSAIIAAIHAEMERRAAEMEVADAA